LLFADDERMLAFQVGRPGRGGNSMAAGQGAADPEVARAFTFFDCTDYIDGTPPKGMLTEALNFKRNDPNAAIPPWEQLKLLILYIAGRVDVHGGYFDGEVAQRLMYRLACLGFDQSLTAYGGEDAMLGECAGHQIRVMPSNRLRTRTRRPREAMDLSDHPA
jgi:hypothetical protein